ncbi:putative DNA-binding domain-containing protein [Polaromonas sp.]|uniref:HvfC/BufC family peptide modification chaperone n=1 Tax=Polaromonas sp. TaxID=1869339 RepID=UPI0035678807
MSAAIGLAAQQQALLQALYLPRHQDAMKIIAACAHPERAGSQNYLERGLQAYRSNGHALAQRVLSAAYPVLAQLTGAESFDTLSRHFWQSHPPVRGDMAQWGAGFADFIKTLADLMREEPYLADVARVEWALHTVATQADGQADLSSFALLESREPSDTALVLSPGAQCLSSVFPVVSIVQSHLAGEPTLQEAGERLRAQVAETALVWRHGLKPSLRQAQVGEAVFIAALQENRSLADSLSAAPGFDFPQWLVPAVQTGLLLSARAL